MHGRCYLRRQAMELVRTAILLVGIGLGGRAIASCRAERAESPPAASPPPQSTHAGEVRSNILRADYAGSEVCAGCHGKQYAAWLESPMHRMTRDSQRTQMSAPFSG